MISRRSFIYAVTQGILAMLLATQALHAVASLEVQRRPWSELAACIGPLDVQTMLLGVVCIASGRVVDRDR